MRWHHRILFFHPAMKTVFRLIPLIALMSPLLAEDPVTCDLLVYGGTPGGIAAAVAAADEGRRVVIVEPFSFVGGLVSNGLTHTDLRSLESTSGVWREFTGRVKKYYADTYGPESDQVKACFEGNFAEPKVNRLVFEKMLAERKGIRVFTRYELENVASNRAMPSAILAAVFRKEGEEKPLTVRARVYVDGTYEGDLMAKAGVKYTIGREEAATYGESIAGNVPAGGDGQVQGYNYRWCVTNAPDRLPAPRPAGYDRAEFLPLLGLFASGAVTNAFGIQSANGMTLPEGMPPVTSRAVYKLQPPLLPNGKADINDMSHGVVRLSMPDRNDGYPAASKEERRRIVDEHTRYQVGMLHFLQHDEAVPASIRQDALSWGFCQDEWPDHGHLPEQLYVREARRMVGMHVFTQNDTRLTPHDVRLPPVADSIAIGDYSHNCHGTGRTGTRFDGKHSGEFYVANAPFQVAYGTLVPNEVTNLLVPVAVSASHVGFGALRLEPVWSALGQAAGLAAHLALAMENPRVQEVEGRTLQDLLHRQGAATLYFSDVTPEDPDFVAVQWLGTLGGWHGLKKPEEGTKVRWASTFGQYAEAYPDHDASLAEPIDEALLARWLELVPAVIREKAKDLKADSGLTRREVVRSLYGWR
jgi:hypothetical protein